MSTATDTKYVYITPDRKVKIILIEEDEHGIIRVSGDVASSSRPMYHHTEILINNNWIRFSCSCEAGAYGFLCNHATELYNVYRKNLMKLRR